VGVRAGRGVREGRVARAAFQGAAARLTADARDSSVRGHGEDAPIPETGSKGRPEGEAAQGAPGEGPARETRGWRGQGAKARARGKGGGEGAKATEGAAGRRDSRNSAAAAGPHRQLHILRFMTSMENPGITAEKREEAAKTLREILDRMGIEAEVSAFDDGERIILDAHGAESGLIIGKKGATLDALQYVINRIISKKPSDGPGVVVDAEGYRGRREDSLADLARRLAEKAIKSGRPVPVEPMSPHDRRIVHVTLKEHPDVTTESEGEGAFRRVVIFPKKGASAVDDGV